MTLWPLLVLALVPVYALGVFVRRLDDWPWCKCLVFWWPWSPSPLVAVTTERDKRDESRFGMEDPCRYSTEGTCRLPYNDRSPSCNQSRCLCCDESLSLARVITLSRDADHGVSSPSDDPLHR